MDAMELMRLADDGCPHCPEHVEASESHTWRDTIIAVLRAKITEAMRAYHKYRRKNRDARNETVHENDRGTHVR